MERQQRILLSGSAYQSSCMLSTLGNSIAAVVLPLLVLQTTGSVLSAGALALATGLPQFLAAICGGVILDRYNRRAIAIVGDVVSGLSIAALALIHATIGLNIAWYVVFGIFSAVGDVPALTAREAMVPALAHLTGATQQRVVAVREALTAAATLIGPAIAAGLVTFATAGIVLWATAVTSMLAALLTVVLPVDVGFAESTRATVSAAAAGTGGGPALAARRRNTSTGRESTVTINWLRDFTSGVRYLIAASPALRAVTVIGTVFVACTGAVQAIALPVHFTALGEPGRTGWTLSVLAIGMMAGAGLFAGLHRKTGPRGTLRVGIALAAMGAWLLMSLGGFAVVLVAVVLLGIGVGVCSALAGVVTLAEALPSMRGRVLGNQNALSFALAPLVTLAVAAFINAASLRAALAGIAVIFTFTLIWALMSTALSAAPAGDVVGGRVAAGSATSVSGSEELE